MTQHPVEGAEQLKGFDAQLRDVQRLAGIGVLARAIAHDFNNQLTVILGNCSLAQADLDPESPVRKRLARVRDAAQQSAALTEQLLAYSDSSIAGTSSAKSIHLPHLLENMQGLLSAAAGRPCEVVIESPATLPIIAADEAQLQQVIVNLVTNASEALEHNPGHAWIRIGVEHKSDRDLTRSQGNPDLPDGDYVFLEVEDDGVGIAKDTRERIFEPFFTTKQQGRGLGLSAVLGIVRSHAGAIFVDSEPGRGTKVRILLPQAGLKT